MVEKYGIVPFRAQEERPPSTKDGEPGERSQPVGYLQGSLDLTSTKDGEPGERSQRYGMKFLRFLEPLVRELDVTVDKRPLRTLVQTVEAMKADATQDGQFSQVENAIGLAEKNDDFVTVFFASTVSASARCPLPPTEPYSKWEEPRSAALRPGEAWLATSERRYIGP